MLLASCAIYSPEAAPAGFVYVSDVVPDVIMEIRYYSTFNFVGERIDGCEQPTALITAEAASALKAVNEDVKAQGCRLKVFDACRPGGRSTALLPG